MPSPRKALLSFLPLCLTGTLADFLGPRNPAPVEISSKGSLVSAAWLNVSSVLDELVNGTTLPGAENITFSAGVFSIHDNGASEALQYHYTSPEVANNPNGTDEVDGDTIYRVASLSKLFTVYTGLLQLKEEEWHRPLSKILPGLVEADRKHSKEKRKEEKEKRDQQKKGGEESLVEMIQWDKITPWALAAQIAGVSRQGLTAADSLVLYETFKEAGDPSVVDPVSYGMPPVNRSVLGPCEGICPPEHYLESVQDDNPTFLPWTNPVYSNNGFILLGLALSNLTGKPIDRLYDGVFEPLDMKSSNISIPPQSLWKRSAITGAPEAGWSYPGGITRGSGGIFSTINDLAKFGKAVLNNTLLPAEQTRKWMKPISHTASLTYSVGAPWEIFRYVHKATGRTTDVYTKLGDSGFYGGVLALIPDYGAGFSLLGTNSNETLRSSITNSLGDVIAEQIIPALEAQAAVEAKKNYAGHYVARAEKLLNSSITIALNETSPDPRLIITSWISNGTQLLDLFYAGKPATLHPTIPDQGDGRIAFRVSANPQMATYTQAGKEVGPLTGQFATNADWLTVDSTQYGGKGQDLIFFDIDKEGRAASATPAATIAILERKEDGEKKGD